MSDNVISYRQGPISSVSMGLPGDHEGKTATRTFLVKGQDRLALIDSGLHAGLASLKSAFESLRYDLADLDYLLLTHEHMDHVGNNGWLKENTGCRILGHPARADRVADNMLNAKAIVHAFPEGEVFDLYTEYLDWMGPTAGAIDQYVRDGELIDLGGGIILEVVEVPGHSAAEVGFFEQSTKSLVIADPLLPPFNPVLYLYEDPGDMRKTFDKIELFLDERSVKTVILAHDEPKDPAGTRELIADCRRRVDKVESSIISHVKSNPGISFAELRDRVCDDQNMVREWRALVSIDASLRVFRDQGLLNHIDGGWHYVA